MTLNLWRVISSRTAVERQSNRKCNRSLTCLGAVRRMSRHLPAAQQRVSGTSEDLSLRVPRTGRASVAHRMLFAFACHLGDEKQRLGRESTVVAIQWGKKDTALNWFFRCASGCAVECRICNREVAGWNLGLGYFAPRSTQPSIPPGSVIEYQLRLGRQRQVWLISIADKRVGVQVKLWNPLRTRAIPECFCGGDSLRRGVYAPYLYRWWVGLISVS